LIENNKNFDEVKKYVEDTSPELSGIIESYDDKLESF
jgi:hypothetical protein